jgi:hypothetical protein
LIVFFIVFNFINGEKDSAYLMVTSPEGKFYYSMNQVKTIEIKGETGITVINIDNGRFRFTQSSCMNKDCIKMGWVSLKNYPVICLPNKVSAYIINKNEENNDFDEVVR